MATLLNNVEEKSNITYKSVLITLITISIPTILEEILSTLIQYVDTAMVGRLGEAATAAVSTTTTINWLIHSIPGAVGVAILALASRAMGAGDSQRIKRVAGQAVFLSIVTGVLLQAAALLLSPYIPIWMGAAKEIQGSASMYFSILSTTLIFRTSSRIFANAIRATKDTRTPMVISIIENILNVVLNWTFIYGLSMGVKGAAIASAISYGLGGIFMYIAFRKNEYLNCPYSYIKPNKTLLADCCHIGLPALYTYVASCFGYVVFAGMVSGMGTTIFAAHAIAVAAEEIVYIPGYGLKLATSTLVGNAYGEKNLNKLKITENLSILITMLIMIVNGALLFIFAYPLMNVFTSSEAVALLGAKMLRMVAFSEPFFGLMIVLEGIEYGMGRTKHVFYIETFSMWCIRILFTFICVKVLHLSLTAVWFCMIADNVVKASVLWYYFYHGKKNFRNKNTI